MKQLLIVRHAQAAPKETDDHSRVLTAEGEQYAQRLGKELSNILFIPDAVLVSTATRANQTYLGIQTGMARELANVQRADNLYHGRLYDIVKLIQATPDNIERLMVIGHNPLFTELVNYLSVEQIEHLKPGGACLLDFAVEHWFEIETSKAQLKQIEV